MIASTSLEAYNNMQPKIKTDHQLILSKLCKNKGFTYNEIAQMLGWKNPNKASRRLPELVRLGLVEVKGVRRCMVAESNCRTYVKL